MMNDLIGQKFGELAVIQRMDNDNCGHLRWLCKCNCGSEVIIRGYDLKRGHTKSCGCLRKEITAQRLTKHGHTKNGKITGKYRSWQDMKKRCTNPNHKRYKDYGGRGIKVCERWLKFENFDEDMSGWKPRLTIERINNNKGYYKENCRWVTPKQQARNRRNSLYVPYKGKQRLLIELCEEHNMPYKIVWNRIYILGLSVERALITSVKR